MSKPRDTDLEGDYDGDKRRAPFDPKAYRLQNSSPAQRRKILFNKVNRSGKGDMEPVAPPKPVQMPSRDQNTGRFANVGLAGFRKRKGGKVVEE
jgi:hypothetical protein